MRTELSERLQALTVLGMVMLLAAEKRGASLVVLARKSFISPFRACLQDSWHNRFGERPDVPGQCCRISNKMGLPRLLLSVCHPGIWLLCCWLAGMYSSSLVSSRATPIPCLIYVTCCPADH